MAPLVGLLDRKLLFVTGKGGVGKTTISAGLALLAATKGKRTLVCEMDAKGDLASSYEVPPVGFDPKEVAPNLWAMSMDPEASLRQYLALQLRLPRVTGMGPVTRMFDFVASAAPGVREIVSVGKLCWEVRERHYDLVVADAVSSGHIIGQLSAPQAINGLVQVGLVRQQTGWMLEILSDRSTCGVVVVATPEEMPVTEAVELAGRLEKETTVATAAVVVNRVLPELFGKREEQAFDALWGPEASGLLSSSLGGDAQGLLEAARWMVTTRRSRAEHLERLRDGFAGLAGPARAPMVYVPYLFLRSHGLRATRQVVGALSAELEET